MRRGLAAFLIVVLATLAAHGASLRGGFHYDDDHTVLLNRGNLTDASTVVRFLSEPGLYSGLPENGMYRPVTYATKVLDAHRASWEGEEPDPLPFHMTNLLVHALAAGVLLLLLRRVTDAVAPGPAAEAAALLGALWFGLHPAHSEVVNYVSARSESLAGLFFLAALWLHHMAWDAGVPAVRRSALVALSVMAGALSHGSKETGALLFAVAATVEVWGRRGTGGAAAALRRLPRALPFLALLLVYLHLRQEALGAALGGITARPAPAGHGEDSYSAAGRSLLAHGLTQARVVVEYGRLLLVPVNLSPDHHVTVLGRWLHGPTLLALAILAAAAAVVLRSLRDGGRVLPLAATWAGCALAPSVLVPLNVVMNEHRMYLPATALALPFGLLAARFRAEAAARGRGGVATATLAALFASFAVLDVARARDWADPARLWGKAVTTDPQSWRAHHHLGVAFLREAGRLRERADGAEPLEEAERERLRVDAARLAGGALERFRAAHALYPQSFATRLNLGTALLDLARFRNRGADPDAPPPHVAEYEEAVRWFTAAEEASPGSGRAQYYRATALAELGRVDEALTEFTRMQRADPTRGHLYDFALADLHRRAGHAEKSLAWLDSALARDPSAAATVALKKSEVFVGAGRFDEADAQLRIAYGLLGGENATMLVYMARMLAAADRAEHVPMARAFWEKALSRGHRPGPKDRGILRYLQAE